MSDIVRIEHLSIHFKQFIALDNITLTIKKTNGVVGLIGPNGAGKTTLINTVIGQLKPYKGGVDVKQEEVAYCPDVPSFEGFLTPKEVLEQTLRLRGKSFKKNQHKITEVLEAVDLIKSQHQYVDGFSRGMKQRLGIASALILDPKIIFLDEPTSALDPFGQKDILKLVKKIAKERVVVISSHNLKEIEKCANELIVLNNGKLIYNGNLHAFISKNEKLMSLEFTDLNVTQKMIESLKEAEISFTIDDNQVIHFDDQAIEFVLSIIIPYAQYIKKIEKSASSLDDAFEVHLQRFHEKGVYENG
ncbi:ATP-binding cassette domain-containing protein [Staphylococcus schleiferi subsp. coagulans]|uniref:ABC transporter ATP-binding protein n=1 Tax=Staphylococcus coagulans TaxID=74706 RepID=UPI0015F7B795|nr:ABC transporter ATP-binding protein [Staphylococcus coagulans]MBA8760067.1 ATP-binding cassette domain-containing protein [Staphylococcus coagulans]MBA8768798.1 ATP-binding cassette domain-containing protein [Staphylococcus coagulans]